MNDTNFVDKVRKYFSFLETEYGFRITKKENSDTRPESDGIVEYTSLDTNVIIDSEIGNAAVWFYRVRDGRKFDLDPVVIHEYINTNDKERELLLSTNTKDNFAAAGLFNSKILLNQPEWKLEGGTVEDKLRLRLKNYSEWLKQHANLCLKGDFSQWPRFYEYKVQRARADLLRRGKDEYVYTYTKDVDGKSKLIKQPAFKEELEHIEKLKREFSS